MNCIVMQEIFVAKDLSEKKESYSLHLEVPKVRSSSINYKSNTEVLEIYWKLVL